MKKLLFTLFLSLLTLTMSAQIQRTFLGNTLGVSTYAQVTSNMTQKGYSLDKASDKDCAIYNYVKFAGYDCKSAYFYFHYNYLNSVMFILEQSFQKESFNSEIEILRNKLIDKYALYIEKNDDYEIKFIDENTLLVVACPSIEDYYTLTIGYMDKELMRESFKSNNDEL